MHDAAGNERRHAGFEHAGLVADGELEAALEHIGDLLVRVLVERDDDVGVELNLADGQLGEVGIVAADRAAEDFFDRKGGESGEGHGAMGYEDLRNGFVPRSGWGVKPRLQ